ncbi:hypothetical protein LzC2_38760 [Planctomycetes bacterium LzC2]|uniref:O-antigen ligase-related domain-containing protein n=1 Tax=Alienimonas chondri TaxID=2681879 RepID=A0ABX1VIP3_9PLAN|nr:hypothetical protein [Alienimonas chondri]
MPWALPGALFVAYAAASAAWSPLRRITLFQSGTLAVLYAVGVAFAVHAAEADLSRALRRLVWTLLGISAGLLVARTAMPGLGVMEREGVSLLHATNTAATASLGLTLAIASRTLFGWGWARRLWPIALPVHGLVLAISSNRLSVVLTVGVVAVLLFAGLSRTGRCRAALLGAVVGLAALAADPGMDFPQAVAREAGEYLQRGQTVSQMKDLSGREEMWTKMWASYRKAPLLGHGYFVTSETGVIEVWYLRGNFTAHNLLLQVLVTTGAAGAALFLAGFAAAPALAVLKLLFDPRYRRFAALAGLFGGWVCVWGLLNESFMGPLQPESVLYFVFYGLTLGAAANVGRFDLRSGRIESESRSESESESQSVGAGA